MTTSFGRVFQTMLDQVSFVFIAATVSNLLFKPQSTLILAAKPHGLLISLKPKLTEFSYRYFVTQVLLSFAGNSIATTSLNQKAALPTTFVPVFSLEQSSRAY